MPRLKIDLSKTIPPIREDWDGTKWWDHTNCSPCLEENRKYGITSQPVIHRRWPVASCMTIEERMDREGYDKWDTR